MQIFEQILEALRGDSIEPLLTSKVTISNDTPEKYPIHMSASRGIIVGVERWEWIFEALTSMVDAAMPTENPPSCPPPLRLALRPPEAARALGIGVRKLWELTNCGEIPHIKEGRAVLYPVAALEEWLASRVKFGPK